MNKTLCGKELGKIARFKMLQYLEPKWGHYQQLASGWSLFHFSNGQKLLSCYSSLNYDRWWFGVSEKYWEKWDKNTWLALLLGEEKLFKMAIFTPKESFELLKGIIPTNSNRQKEINIRIPATGKPYIQEMSQLPIDRRLVDLGEIDSPKKPTMVINSQKDDDFDRLVKYFQTMTEAQKQTIIDLLKEKAAELN